MSDPWADQNAGQQPPPPPAAPPAYGEQPGWGQAPGYGQPGPGQPGYGQPAYGQAPGYGAPPIGRPTSGKATTVMVLGIASLVLMVFCGLGFIPAIIALVTAGSAEREIAESGGALDGAGQIKAGRIMAWVTLGLSALVLVLVAGVVALSFGIS